QYTKWLTMKTGRFYRLPTEAEWEYACRAGTTTPWSCGPALTREAANINRSLPSGVGSPAPQLTVGGRHAPNRWGLFDMHGNVWEWCTDWYSADYYGVSAREDPWGPSSGTARVLRGGSANSHRLEARSAIRSWAAPDQVANKGFRLAASLPVPSAQIDPPASSTAGEKAPADGLTAAERLRRAISDLPPPSRENQIDVRVELRMEGAAVGRGYLRALPGTAEDGSPVWNVTDHLDGAAVVMHNSSILDQRLAPIEGSTRLTFREDGRIVEIQWRRAPAGIAVTFDKDKEPALLKTTSTIVHGLTHTLLLARLVHPAAGQFAYYRFRPETLIESGLNLGPLRLEELQLGRKAQWKRRRTWMAEAPGLEAHLDHETGRLLTATLDSMMGMRFDVRPVDAEPDGPANREAFFARPPATPRQIVLQAVVAMSQGDVTAVEELIHWPRFGKGLGAGTTEAGEDWTVDTFKADFLKNIAANRQGTKPTELVQLAMYNVRNDLDVRNHEENEATVVLPAILAGRTFRVAEIEGRWYIVGMGG
ncbi:MAG: formylglycine-generating enzyme family protein, partial [bacterium]|nr:formylglycine-generating enzyme family protein [bacterium]